MKINLVEVEQILLLNMNVQVVEFCNIWLTIGRGLLHIFHLVGRQPAPRRFIIIRV